MQINTGDLKDPYVRLRVPLKVVGSDIEQDAIIQVKLDDEGVVVDFYARETDQEPAASTWRLYQEMIEPDEDDLRPEDPEEALS